VWIAFDWVLPFTVRIDPWTVTGNALKIVP
jgi:hypothetical protein